MESSLPTQQQALANKRREKDVMKLMVSEYEVTLSGAGGNLTKEFFVKLKGPINSPYEGVSRNIHANLGNLGGARHSAGTVPLQVTLDRLRQQGLPPEHRRSV